MIKQISWASYWITIAVAVSLYYIMVGLKFYFPEIKELFSKKFIPGSNAFSKSKTESDELFPLLNQLTQELKMFLENAVERNLKRQEILHAIQLLLRKYPLIKTTSFQGIVTSYIINECSNHCSIHLEEADVIRMWTD